MKKYTALLIGLVLSGSASAGITDGLIAHYTFNGHLADDSGYGNNGIAQGNVEYIEGIDGQAVRLHGVLSDGGTDNPDHILVKNSASLAVLNNSLTISYFVQIAGTKAQSNSDRSIVDGMYGTAIAKQGDRSGYYVSEWTDKSEFGINLFSNGPGLKKKTSGSAQIAAIKHVVYTVDNNTVSLYINGSLIKATNILTDFTSSNNQDLYIGVQNNPFPNAPTKDIFWYPLDGSLDELRIYNRAITLSEINELYHYADDNLANANTLFSLAEQFYANLFSPANQPTFTKDGIIVRYYPATDTYLGLNGKDVYMLKGQTLTYIGKVHDFI